MPDQYMAPIDYCDLLLADAMRKVDQRHPQAEASLNEALDSYNRMTEVIRHGSRW